MKATEFITHVENTLGWSPPEGTERWKAVVVEAGKLNRKIKENPKLYTWDNLLLAVELLRRERTVIKSPVFVCWHVERALEQVHREDVGDLATQMHIALTEAFAAGEPEWVERLSRATGQKARLEILQEWRQHHAH